MQLLLLTSGENSFLSKLHPDCDATTMTPGSKAGHGMTINGITKPWEASPLIQLSTAEGISRAIATETPQFSAFMAPR